MNHPNAGSAIITPFTHEAHRRPNLEVSLATMITKCTKRILNVFKVPQRASSQEKEVGQIRIWNVSPKGTEEP